MQARKTMHGLDGQHQDVDRTPRGRVSQNDSGQINGESMSMVWPTLRSRTAKEQNRTVVLRCICVADISLLLITVLSQDVPEFELHFDKVYKWVASSIAEKNAFILSLWKAS